jgi:tripartite-type tricarboxylate transporter receptor subunit TctC
VRTSAADGYTLLSTSSTFAQAIAFKVEPGYEIKDFAPIGGILESPLIMVGAPAQPAKTFPEFLAQVRAQPGKLSYASGGFGASTWMAAALMLHDARAEMLHVPYKGTAAAMPDVLAGRVNMVFDSVSSTAPHIREGKLRAYGVSSARRLSAFPDVPTLAEQGLPGYEYSVYLGLFAPAGTPKEVVQRISSALRAALNDEGVRKWMATGGSDPMVTTPEQFGERVQRDALGAAKLVSDLHIPKQ